MEQDITNNSPAAQNPVESPAGAPAAATPAQVAVPAAQQSVTSEGAQTPNVPAESPAADPRAEINSLADQLGVDPAMLADVNDLPAARQKVSQWLEQQAREGAEYWQQLQQEQYAQQYPQTVPGTAAVPQYEPQRDQYGRFVPQQQPAAPAAPTVDLKALGLEADDPVAKVVLAMDARAQQQQQKLDQLLGHITQQQQQARAQAQAERTQRAEGAIDTWNSPLYGKSGRRSIAQQARVEQIYSLANYVLASAHAEGRQLPIEQVINRARFQLEHGGEQDTPKQTGVYALPSASPPPPAETPGLSIMERWSENPQFMASLPR